MTMKGSFPIAVPCPADELVCPFEFAGPSRLFCPCAQPTGAFFWAGEKLIVSQGVSHDLMRLRWIAPRAQRRRQGTPDRLYRLGIGHCNRLRIQGARELQMGCLAIPSRQGNIPEQQVVRSHVSSVVRLFCQQPVCLSLLERFVQLARLCGAIGAEPDERALGCGSPVAAHPARSLQPFFDLANGNEHLRVDLLIGAPAQLLSHPRFVGWLYPRLS